MNGKTWIALLLTFSFTLCGVAAAIAAGAGTTPAAPATQPMAPYPTPAAPAAPAMQPMAPPPGTAAPATQQAAPRPQRPKASPGPSARAAPSFNCAKASNAVERAVCSDSTLAELDVQVAAEYRKALGLHFDKAALKENQRQWLREMHSQCANTPVPCAQKYYKVRLSQLVQHNDPAQH